MQAYLLGELEFETAFSLQRRLAYEVAGDPGLASVLLCHHPAGITVGRHGSRAHIRLTEEELSAREWGVRWVSRGGGVTLHVPGQVACYPVLPLRSLGLTPAAYVAELVHVVADLCHEFGLAAEVEVDRPAVRVRGRRVATFGVAVRDWVTSYGMVVNVGCDLEWFRVVECDGDPVRMTSLQRESPSPVRVPAVRQRLVELIARRFGFERLSVFHNHPAFLPRAPRHAVPARHR
jgi:lipoyl(octanoyl) transferase